MHDYRISLWNYSHYARPGRLEEAVAEISRAGFGLELWRYWPEIPGFPDIADLFDISRRERLHKMLQQTRSSWHSGAVEDFEGHRRQIDCASDVGSDVIVAHADNLRLEAGNPDFAFAREVVAYAQQRRVMLCIENGPLEVIARALEGVDDLMVCLDTGHTYIDEPRPGVQPCGLRPYLEALKPRIAHLHLQDTLPEGDHYTPGLGTIPQEDWESLLQTLVEIEFRGAWVMEIQPLRPVPVAQQAVAYLQGLERGRIRK